ncbi:O-acyltransferase like protein-like isoform X2 [Mercenaria mercenaria]|nr:O-acyltransferase like protein-like isoform X2 [Mercenaria mercenaria]XP_053379880.1 O-acyltransferase like protein-like isoform X2 [Mercenaria mercenaria]
MTRCTTTLAAMYLSVTLLLVYVPVIHTTEAISQSQQQLVYLLHNIFKVNTGMEQTLNGLLQAEKNVSDDVNVPPGVTISPLMNILLMAVKNLQFSQPHVNVSSTPERNTSLPSSGDIMSALSNNPLVNDVISIVTKQIITAVANNVTVGTDLTSLLGVIKPVDIVKTLLTTHSARAVIPNQPSGHVNDACYRDLMDTFDSLVATKPWAIQMLDALGKPASGIERGHFYFVGAYDQCYQTKPHIDSGDVIGNVKQTMSRDFGTRFCRTDITIPQSFIDSLHVDTHGVHLKLTLGLCLPDTCHLSDVYGFLKLDTIENLSPPELESGFCYDEEDITSDSSAIAAICVLSVFGALILFGTAYDIYKASRTSDEASRRDVTYINTDVNNVNTAPQNSSHITVMENKTEIILPAGYMPHKEGACPLPTVSNGNLQNGLSETEKNYTQQARHTKQASKRKDSLAGRLIVCFSLYTNVPKLLSAKSSSGSITCIHGIRFLSLTWVVLGHTYNYGIISQDEAFTADNLLDFIPIMQRFTFQGVVAGGFAVDTFFVLSAFLLTWLQLKETSKKKKKCTVSDGVMYYFHRFWRLTPIYMLVIMSFACFYRYLGSGPFWPSTIWAAEHCKTVWWTNLLYVNNLVENHAQCMGWTWYLANDMQFYVISPIFLIFMYIIPVVGTVLTTLLLCMGIGIAFWKEYEINGNFFTMKSDDGAFWNEVYTVPWCRVGCWAVGMLLGFLIYKRDRKPLRNKSLAYLGWLVSTAVALALVYSTYSENKEDGTEWTNTQRAFYEAFGRPAWGLCVSWVIFACYNHMGGLVNSILSWNGFIPLSRLTYAAYLVHPICMMIYVFSRRTMLHVNDYNIIYLYLGHLCVTYMVAFVCSAAFEAPAMSLEKILFRRGRRS